MKNWPTARLGNVLRLDLDRVPIDASSTYPMVGVLSFGRGLFDRGPIENGQTSYKYFHRLKAEHVVMSQLFGWEGALALSNDQFSGKYLSPQFPTFICDPKKLDRQFLGRLMQRKVFWDDLGSRTSGMGDRRRTLNPEALFACEIPLPPLTEQQRIVARVEAMASKIHEASKIREDQETEIKQMLLGVFWDITKKATRRLMRDVAPLIRRPVKVESTALYPELGIRSFGNGTFHKPELSGFELGGKRIFKIEPGDLLFSNVFAWEGAIAVAQPADKGRFGSHRFITCVAKPGVVTERFLCFYFLTNEGLELINSASPGGAGRNRTLGLEALANIRVPLPSHDEQRRFDTLQAEVDNLKNLQAKTNSELNALLPAILDRAFKGELL